MAKIKFRVCLVALCALPIEGFAMGSFQNEMSCVSALVKADIASRDHLAVLVYKKKDETDEKVLIAVPLRKGTQHELYLFDKDTAYRAPLRNDKDREASALANGLFGIAYKSYFIDLKIPGEKDISWHLLGDYPPNSTNTARLWSWGLAQNDKVARTIGSIKVHEASPDIVPEVKIRLDDESKKVLHEALRNQIARSHEIFLDRAEKMTAAERAHFGATGFVSALEACRSVPALKDTATDELKKYEGLLGPPAGNTKPVRSAK